MNTCALQRFAVGKAAVGLALALLATCLLNSTGCVSRRQYAINEAILISERRQLEDEIYRVQFELRDALEENERLRLKLDEENGDGGAKKRPESRRSDNPNFPGGAALNVGGSASNNANAKFYDQEEQDVETLPDFVPIPNSRVESSKRAYPNYSAPAQSAPRAGPRNLGATASANYVAPARSDSRESGVEQVSLLLQDDAYDEYDDNDWSPAP